MVSAFDSKVSILAVCEKSAMGGFDLAIGEFDFGESCKIIPPGPLGTAWNDFPKNMILAGIPVDHALVMSSNVLSGPAFCLECNECNFPIRNVNFKQFHNFLSLM